MFKMCLWEYKTDICIEKPLNAFSYMATDESAT